MTTPTTEWVEVGASVPLAPLVDRIVGYRLSGYSPGVHAGLPSRSLTFIVAFDAPLEVADEPTSDAPSECHDVLLAGLHDRPSWVRHDGNQHGIQISLSPLGARALFGVPARDLAGRSLSLDDVAPRLARRVSERVPEADGWAARLAVVDDELRRSLRVVPEAPAEVRRAWGVLVATGGSARVSELCDEVGWSRRHLTARFRDVFGLTPKVAGRVLRFERSRELVAAPSAPGLAHVAAACGYADQAHMARDWRQLAGASPTKWLASEEFPNVQDGDGR